MVNSSVLHLCPHSVDSQGANEDQVGPCSDHSNSSNVAKTALVHHAGLTFNGGPNHAPSAAGPDLPEPWVVAPPEPQLSAREGLESSWLNPGEQACSEQVCTVLLGSRKPSTRAAYRAKWKWFSIWSSQHGVPLMPSALQLILDYLLSLRQQSLVLPSLRVHLAVISAFHLKIDNGSFFSPEMVVHFLKGRERVFPQMKEPTPLLPPPLRDLNCVLSKLTGPPFELLATCSLLHLSWKVAFLVAIMSTRRVSEI